MHSHLKNNEAALKDIDRAIELAPHNSFHYQFRGILNFGLERNEVALENFTKAIELMPEWAGHYVWRAAVYYELHDVENTLRDLDTAVTLRPDEVSLFWRGLFYLDTGETWKALYDLQAAYKEAIRPVHSRIVFWLAVAHLLTSHIEEALELFAECSRLSIVDERKVARFSEPARLALIIPTLRVKQRTLTKSSNSTFALFSLPSFSLLNTSSLITSIATNATSALLTLTESQPPLHFTTREVEVDNKSNSTISNTQTEITSTTSTTSYNPLTTTTTTTTTTNTTTTNTNTTNTNTNNNNNPRNSKKRNKHSKDKEKSEATQQCAVTALARSEQDPIEPYVNYAKAFYEAFFNVRLFSNSIQ
jgi:hypothetical protein